MAENPVDPETSGEPAQDVQVQAPADEAADPAGDLKARYREALAHKHGSSGAHKTVHGDQGEVPHPQSSGPTQKLFRRKAGG
jgi:hypothetical protein